MKKPLPIGIDDFGKVRSRGYCYVDKSLMICDFVEMQDAVALIARPRRFEKTLNMTMLRDFFDITKDSRPLFEGLAVMNSPCADQINSRPVLYFTFKDCKARNEMDLCEMMKSEIYREYLRYEKIFRGYWPMDSYESRDFYDMMERLRNPEVPFVQIALSLRTLSRMVCEYYGKEAMLFIDEYDQPIMSSYEYGYHSDVSAFFSNFYGSALKGNPDIAQALITGVQRVAKESIFSHFNNPQVYTVMSQEYAPYFGLSQEETETLFRAYGLELTEQVRATYDGYQVAGKHMYNPWSVLNYVKTGRLDNYWLKTSANFLVKQALKQADRNFWKRFDRLAMGECVQVTLTLDTSYAERDGNYSLWGLLVNAGYLTVAEQTSKETAYVRIPNGEVRSEFQILVSELSGVEHLALTEMFDALLKKDMDTFMEIYQNIVISCTSYMDAKENAYHMLFLGMCVTLCRFYKVTSNLESGYGRSDIMLKSLSADYPSIIVEFKQGEPIDVLKQEALQQILKQKYYAGLTGEVICIGLAHDKKRCEMVYETIVV